jgi:hypothetical protein
MAKRSVSTVLGLCFCVSIAALAPVALGLGGLSDPVVFAGSTTKPQALSVSGAANKVVSPAHSNRDASIAGAGSAFGLVSYVATFTKSGGATATTATKSAVRVNPATWKLQDYAPGGRAATAAGSSFFDWSSRCGKGTVTLNGTNTALPVGLYWIPCNLAISGASVSAVKATFVSTGAVQVAGPVPIWSNHLSTAWQ